MVIFWMELVTLTENLRSHRNLERETVILRANLEA